MNSVLSSPISSFTKVIIADEEVVQFVQTQRNCHDFSSRVIRDYDFWIRKSTVCHIIYCAATISMIFGDYCDVVATAKCWQQKCACALRRFREHYNKFVIDNLRAFFIAHIQGHLVSQELHAFFVYLGTRQASSRHEKAYLFRWHSNFLRIFRLRQRFLFAVGLDAGSKVIASLNLGAFLPECFDRFSPSSFCRHFWWLQSKKLS